jgi:hypothetical protein
MHRLLILRSDRHGEIRRRLNSVWLDYKLRSENRVFILKYYYPLDEYTSIYRN